MRAQRSKSDLFDEPEGSISRLGGVALENPVATGGLLVMVLTATLITANAVSFQPGPHPAPLFGTTRVVGSVPLPPRVPEAQASDLVREIQVSLQRIGYYNGPLDGLRGPMTDDAVRAYERAASLSETGEVSHSLLAHMLLNGGSVPTPPRQPQSQPQSLSKSQPQSQLQSADPAASPQSSSYPVPSVPIPPKAPSSGNGSTSSLSAAAAEDAPARGTVRSVQQALADLGYGPVTIDGYLGNETASALRRFELDRGMAITGKMRPEIYASLEKSAGVKIPR